MTRADSSWGAGLTVVVVGGRLSIWPFIADTGHRLGIRLIAAIKQDIEDDVGEQGWDRVLSWTARGPRTQYEKAADGLALALRGERVDGVVTFSDYCVPLAGMLAERLNVARCPADALWSCKSKFELYRLLHEAGSPYPPQARVLDSRVDLAACVEAVGLPAIVRISHGYGAIGTRLGSDLVEIAERLERVRSLSASPEYDFSGFQQDVLLVEYLQGSEHDIDVVMMDGDARFWYVTDNGPTDLPYFRETTHLLPSRLPPSVQAQLFEASVSCLRALGLRQGVFNVEMRLTADGPRLIEINLRMGGFYIRKFTEYVWGYDLCEAAFRCHLCGFMCFPSDTVSLADVPAVALNIDCGESAVTEYEVPMRMLSFPGATVAEAVHRAVESAPRILGKARGATVQGYLRSFLP